MTRTKFFVALVFAAWAALPSWALVDTNEYRIIFNKPVDTAFIAGDTLNVNISVINQADSLMPGLVPVLTVRTTGMGGVPIVNAQRMIDNRDGTYSYPNILLRGYPNANLEIRVDINVKGTIHDGRVNIYHGPLANPNAATTAWKIEFIKPLPTISADTTTLISVNLYNEAGALWSSGLMIIVMDTNGASIVAAPMVAGMTIGLYTYLLNGTLLNAGADYVIRVVQIVGGGGGVRTSLFVEAYSKIVLPVLIPVTPDPSPTRKPTFKWHPAAGATVYTLQIDTNPAFASPIVNTQLADTSYTPLLNLPIDVVYWRVSSDLTPGRYTPASSVTILDRHPGAYPLYA